MHLTVFLGIVFIGFSLSQAGAQNKTVPLTQGVYNTGASLVEEAQDASLDIHFHPCQDNEKRYCASILKIHEPNGSSGQTMLPNGEQIIGFQFIRGLKPVGNGEYRRGRIVAVDESIAEGEMREYGFRLKQNEDGTITARGCLGAWCPRVMTWTPAPKAKAPETSDAGDI
ncbi:MAG: DUF2147 domain-containing protein [Pseudomonadota bacterium]